MATSVPVAAAGEIQPGERKTVDVDGTEITLLNVDGEYHAVRNFCPHMGGPVGNGPVVAGDGGLVIKCPFHGWRFDLDTGDVVFPGKQRVQTFEVTVADLEEAGLTTYDVDVVGETIHVEL